MTRSIPALTSLPRRLGALLLVLLVGGCASISPGPAPETVLSLPEQFSEPAGTQPLPDRWWRHFDDPRLDRLVETALTENFSLQAARERLRAAQATARREGAAQRPSVDASARGGAEADDAGNRSDSYGLGAAAAYELDLWGRLESNTAAARFDAAASRAELEAAAISLSAETASTFYELLQQRGVRALLESQLQTNRQVLELVELRYRNGAASSDEVLRQEQLIGQTRGILVEADAALVLLEHQLAVLTGQPPAEVELPSEARIVEVPPLPDTGLPAEWLQRRPDLRQAFFQLRAADARVASAVAARYPRIDLSASLDSVAESPSTLFGNWLGGLAANLAAPIFDGGQRAAEVDRSQASRAAELQTYGQTVLEAVREVEDALTAERRDRALLASLEERVARSERIVDQLRTRYLNGSANYIDVLDALSSQQQLQRELLAARWALAQGRITLARVLAGGWDAETPALPILDTRLQAETDHVDR